MGSFLRSLKGYRLLPFILIYLVFIGQQTVWAYGGREQPGLSEEQTREIEQEAQKIIQEVEQDIDGIDWNRIREVSSTEPFYPKSPLDQGLFAEDPELSIRYGVKRLWKLHGHRLVVAHLLKSPLYSRIKTLRIGYDMYSDDIASTETFLAKRILQAHRDQQMDIQVSLDILHQEISRLRPAGIEGEFCSFIQKLTEETWYENHRGNLAANMAAVESKLTSFRQEYSTAKSHTSSLKGSEEDEWIKRIGLIIIGITIILVAWAAAFFVTYIASTVSFTTLKDAKKARSWATKCIFISHLNPFSREPKQFY